MFGKLGQWFTSIYIISYSGIHIVFCFNGVWFLGPAECCVFVFVSPLTTWTEWFVEETILFGKNLVDSS